MLVHLQDMTSATQQELLLADDCSWASCVGQTRPS